jgi:hypothetical protein
MNKKERKKILRRLVAAEGDAIIMAGGNPRKHRHKGRKVR